MSETIICPECGFANAAGSTWCDSCGVPLPQIVTSHQAATGAKEWLEREDVVTLELDARMVAHRWPQLADDLPERLRVCLRVIDSSEVSSVRRVSQVQLVELLDPAPAPLREQLTEQRYILEELGPMLGTQHPRHPDSTHALLRLPLAESLRQSHRLRLFAHDQLLSLEELVIEAQGQLTPRQIRRIFNAVLRAVEDLHARGFLFLRLSPWTVHLPREILRHGEFHAQAFVATSLQEDTSVESLRRSQSMELGSEQTQEFDPADVRAALSQTAELITVQPSVSDDDAFEEIPVADESPTLAAPSEPQPSTLNDFDGYPLTSSAEDAPTLEALLDGSFRLFELHEERMEIPVIMGFSAPEMFSRTRTELGVASDVFSLGMILYFLIAGELPPTSVYTRHTPSLPARNFRPEFPLGLHHVVSRAGRPDLRERYASVSVMREAFERACALMDERQLNADAGRGPLIKLCVERHVGITKKLRNPINQDQVFGQCSEDGRFALVVVADGVSTASYGSGDLASECLRRAAEEAWPDILSRYQAQVPVDEYELIHGILERANRYIIEYVNVHCLPFRGNPHEVMGSTALVSIIHRGYVTLGALGDSRAYLQRGHAFEQITTDHNLWTLSVLDGVAADNALALAHGDALARCLGTFYLDDQRLVAIPPQPDMFRFAVTAGDALLLTTDGLIDFAGPNAQAAEDNSLSILLAEPNPDLACLELILLANRGGGGDNIGVALMRFL